MYICADHILPFIFDSFARTVVFTMHFIGCCNTKLARSLKDLNSYFLGLNFNAETWFGLNIPAPGVGWRWLDDQFTVTG